MMRLGGIFLSLATLAFAFFFDKWCCSSAGSAAGTQILVVPRPVLGPIDFSKGDKAYLVSALVVLAIVSIAVIWVRSGTTGRYARRDARQRGRGRVDRDQPPPRADHRVRAVGRDRGSGRRADDHVHRTSARRRTSTPIFVPELGLAWIVLVVTLGSRTVEGAINAAVGFVFFQAVILPTWIPFAVNHLQPWYHMTALPAGLQPILFGLGALTYAKHPEGHSRVPEAPLVRAHPGLDRPVQGRRQGQASTSAAPDDPGGTRVVAAAGARIMTPAQPRSRSPSTSRASPRSTR